MKDSFSALIPVGTEIKKCYSFTWEGMLKIGGLLEAEVVFSDAPPSGLIIDKGGYVTAKTVKTGTIIVTCSVEADELRAESLLVIAPGAQVKANRIYYRKLEIAPGAVINNVRLFHLDHCSQGEEV